MTDQTRTLPPYSPDDPPVEGTVPAAQPWSPARDPWSSPAAPPAAPPAAEAPPAGRDRSPRRGVGLLVALAVTAGLLGGGAGAALTAALDEDPVAASTSSSSLNQPAASTDTPAAQGSVEQVASAVLPSVVSIQVQAAGGSGEGTGVILSSDGLVLTNNHVVASAAAGGEVQVTFNDGTTAEARIVGRDPVTDLAVIEAQGVSGLTAATLGSSADLDPGEQVVAIGSPLGLQGTVTSGIVSALNRPVRTGDSSSVEASSTVIDAIQTDAAINPGNSGGPLVNLRGEVVGINSAIATLGAGGQSGSIGLGFSIPVDQARAIAQQLIDSGTATHARLGVSVQDSTDGAVVAQIASGSAATEAGLQVGDVLTKVDDRVVEGADSLIAAIRSYRPGDEVVLTYRRGSDESTVTVTLGSDAG
jgi:putative serine protease PepD